MKRDQIEIMAPVGSYESLRGAIEGGANSIYFGVGALNMRKASAANFSLEDLCEIVRIAHQHNIKAYLTINTIVYDSEIEQMYRIVEKAKSEGVDAVIASDQSVIQACGEIGLPVHISTQLNVSNYSTLKFYAQWADVVVLARELTLEQIKAIYQRIERDDLRGVSGERIKIEMFAHGALCMAVSGKCYLSLHDCGESANRGACRQVCRRSYELRDRDTGAEIEAQGQYLLSPKDLCTIEFLDRFIDSGVRVLKIEGRARGGEYVKRVCQCYNRALMAIETDSFTSELKQELVEGLRTVFNRDLWGGYYLGSKVVELSKNYGSSATKRKVYVGKVTNFFSNISVMELGVEASVLHCGDELLVLGSTTGVKELVDYTPFVDDKPCEEVVQGVKCSIKTDFVAHRGDKVYKLVKTDQA